MVCTVDQFISLTHETPYIIYPPIRNCDFDQFVISKAHKTVHYVSPNKKVVPIINLTPLWRMRHTIHDVSSNKRICTFVWSICYLHDAWHTIHYISSNKSVCTFELVGMQCSTCGCDVVGLLVPLLFQICLLRLLLFLCWFHSFFPVKIEQSLDTYIAPKQVTAWSVFYGLQKSF